MEENRIRKLLGSNREIAWKIFCMSFGNFLCSVAINVFFVPNGLLSTGVGGLGIIFNYLLGAPIGLTVFILNLPLMVLGYFKLDRKFMVYTTFSVFIYSWILNLTSGLSEIFIIDDIFIAAVFGALFNGMGMGIMFRNDVCQGGFDILASILKKYYNMNIGTGLSIFNTTVVTLSAFKFGAIRSMYTLVAIKIGYKVLDRIQIGFSYKKNIIIISDKSAEMADKIMKNMGRGVTFLKGEGAYTHVDKNIIYCTLTSPEIVKLKEIVNEVDPRAFFTVSEAAEVMGTGFSK